MGEFWHFRVVEACLANIHAVCLLMTGQRMTLPTLTI